VLQLCYPSGRCSLRLHLLPRVRSPVTWALSLYTSYDWHIDRNIMAVQGEERGEGKRPLVGSLDVQHPMRRGPSSEICGDCCHHRRCYCFVARPSNKDACIACRRERVIEYRLGDASSGLLTCLTTESFVRAVGSRSSAPGGGSVAALLAALVSSV
jgi:hypothetical protein